MMPLRFLAESRWLIAESHMLRFGTHSFSFSQPGTQQSTIILQDHLPYLSRDRRNPLCSDRDVKMCTELKSKSIL